MLTYTDAARDCLANLTSSDNYNYVSHTFTPGDLVFLRPRLNIKFSVAHPFHDFRITMVKETTRLCVQGCDSCHVFGA